MLAGRDSLIRLVGKRKRTFSSSLANSLLLDKPPLPSPPLLPLEAANVDSPINSLIDCGMRTTSNLVVGAFSSKHDGEVNVGKSCDSDSVDCPVCGSTVTTADHAANRHLDSCLARGTKRKFTQRTLLQMNFISKSCNRVPSYLCKDDRYIRERELNANNEGKILNSAISVFDSESTCQVANNPSRSLHSKLTQEICGTIMADTLSNDTDIVDDTGNILISCCLSVINGNNLPDYASGISGSMLQTLVVGRRFHDNVELCPGAGISVMREPENAKDHYAIKVFCTVSGCEKILGYLPRELAKYLSPLIDIYGLKIEGFVTAIPEFPPDAIPICLTCEQIPSYLQKEPDGNGIFESMWKSAVHIAEHSKNYPVKKLNYQQSFRTMCQVVMDQHSHLFDDNEKSFIESFASLSNCSKNLFIRLLTRKGPWFRISKIWYREVLNLQKAIKELQLAGYVTSFDSLKEQYKDVMKVSDMLTTSELREISNLLLLKPDSNSSRKRDLINFLCTHYLAGTCPLLPGIISEKAGICIKISSFAESLLWRIQSLFFLNGEQDLSAFLLLDLGLVKYPSYICNVSQPLFIGQNSFLAYEEAIEVAQIMDQSIDENNVQMVNKCISISERCISSLKEVSESSSSGCCTMFLSHFSASWVFSKVVTLGVSFLEREHSYEDAVKLLKGLLQNFSHDGRRGHWIYRLSIDLEHIGLVNESLSVAEEGILEPWVRAGSRVALQRRVLRLGRPPRRWKTPSFAAAFKRKIKEIHVKGRPLNCETGMKNRYYGYDGQQCSVEQLALQYYSTEGGWHGVHTESGIWMTIFGLLLWDALFADIPDAFRTSFQTAPLDLDSDSFYGSRRDLIESQLLKIKDGMAEEILIISWESQKGTACRGVNWNNHSLSDLRAVVSCVGGRCLAAICRLLAQDYRSWSSGMPDLLLWRFHGEGIAGEAKLVEVKGPKDRLSEQQLAWMLFLMDSGFDAEVCRVGSNI